jgi:hypothetical protein
MTSASDFDPQARAKRIHDLLADKGTVLDPGTVVLQGSRGGPEPEAANSTGVVIHHVSSSTYIDESGHLHAVLFDEVVTGTQGGGAGTTVLEILADVAVS